MFEGGIREYKRKPLGQQALRGVVLVTSPWDLDRARDRWWYEGMVE